MIRVNSKKAVHTSNFMENKKAEKAFLKIEKRADYDLLILSLKAR